jgi:hypothetical protein
VLPILFDFASHNLSKTLVLGGYGKKSIKKIWLPAIDCG